MPQNEIDFIPHTPAVLKQIFSRRGITPSKRFGQNFLIDQNILLCIPDIADLKEDDVILEIGTGTGGLTRLLAARSRHVFTVEVDKKLFELSSDILKFYANITLVNTDVLKTKHELNPDIISLLLNWLKEHNQPRIKVVSNLPYNISTPVIINLLEGDLPVDLMVMMLQKEITERMTAIPGTREYGILSVITQLFSEVAVVKTLPPEVFWPRPEIHSALVKVVVHKEKYAGRITDYPFFRKIIYAIFTSRRKTLINSLENITLPKISREHLKGIIRDMQLDERIRGECLSVDQLIYLSDAIGKLKKLSDEVS
ncbi:MAG: ribosomal RNA small subunit methyltransferase A [Candidatus Brocadia sp. AMX2]|uniref:Ribosomal RNA small subunit methyltransferase A n=1 Tax=Candidatus Brocadia sinica JPN1 TaxID=1197129 RepID=A0ABQ0JSK1_9BACT|nr:MULTISPECIES: 16S rRNA (adenine(1518)-N(6)/adenine(1519)-N(6))-dimethyltransferase RsmA [Brocadia]KXK28365.1 MAG: dimethyladenosine transferase [Candidatus Brocadia sinica]MBC6931346.1 ribosomal RNA small subunit methyltransferase A [Candidatus Brocadia sp.]MBL1168693.1 ribosomal RNA small subunit methyltransferase A [Candidatus Brocadia sp. AMX1]NOG43293.1 ribosomal RNA small subunit methyltransferase A [Planctomycetota bacterium]KAA0245916.1 MAG: ribosomal RNA small subunit methyltransfer